MLVFRNILRTSWMITNNFILYVSLSYLGGGTLQRDTSLLFWARYSWWVRVFKNLLFKVTILYHFIFLMAIIHNFSWPALECCSKCQFVSLVTRLPNIYSMINITWKGCRCSHTISGMWHNLIYPQNLESILSPEIMKMSCTFLKNLP